MLSFILMIFQLNLLNKATTGDLGTYVLNGEWDLLGRWPSVTQAGLRGFQFSTFEAFLDLLWFSHPVTSSCVWTP